MLKTDFDETLKKINLSRQEFANLTNLTYGAVSNWNDDKKPIPGWVDSWLQNYIDKKKFDNIKAIIKDELD